MDVIAVKEDGAVRHFPFPIFSTNTFLKLNSYVFLVEKYTSLPRRKKFSGPLCMNMMFFFVLMISIGVSLSVASRGVLKGNDYGDGTKFFN